MTDFMPIEAPARSPQEIPAVIPAKLVGRDPALKQVYGQLKQGNPVLISGAAGVGKTALAATLASAYSQQPAGVLWMNVNNPRLEELLVRVGRAYNVTEITNSDNPVGMIGAVENTLSQHKPLIVIDGQISADVATRFTTRCVNNLPMMIVTEQKLDGPWAALEMPPLAPADAIALFKQEARIADNASDGDVQKITTQVSNMPLGIVVAAKAMLASKQPPADYANILAQVAQSTGATGSVVALAASFRALTNALQGVLLLMGATFNGRISADLLSIVSGAPLDNIKQAVNILSQLKLVDTIQQQGNPYYAMHTINHRFVQTWLSNSDRLTALQDKARDSIIAYAEKHNQPSAESYDALALEMQSFLAMAKWATENGNTESVNRLVALLTGAGDFVQTRGYVYDVLLLRNLASGSTSAFPGHPYDPAEDLPPAPPEDLPAPLRDVMDDDEDDDFDEFDDDDDEFDDDDEQLNDLMPPASPVGIDLSNASLPDLRNHLAQVKQSGDTAQQIATLKAIGEQQVAAEMNNEAIATYTDMLTVYEESNNQTGMLETYDMVSALMAKTENSQAAIMQATQGVKLAESLNDDTTRMHLLTTLGDAHQQLGESDSAMSDYTNALSIARNANDTQNEAIILHKLGYAQLDGTDPQTAVDTWEQALALFKTQEKRDYEGKTMGALGSAHGDMDEWSTALSLHLSALYIAREVGDMDEALQQLNSLGYAAVQAKDLGQAVMRYRQALHLAFEAGKRDDIVSNLVDLARLLVESRKHLQITKMLVDKAITLDPNDPDVMRLAERVNSEIVLAQAYETNMLPVNGDAETYASNAYSLLDA